MKLFLLVVACVGLAHGMVSGATIDGIDSPEDEWIDLDVIFNITAAGPGGLPPDNVFELLYAQNNDVQISYRIDTFAPTNYEFGPSAPTEDLFICINRPSHPAPFAGANPADPDAIGCASPTFRVDYVIHFDTTLNMTRLFDCAVASTLSPDISGCSFVDSLDSFINSSAITVIEGEYVAGSVLTEIGHDVSLIGIDPATSPEDINLVYVLQEQGQMPSNTDDTSPVLAFTVGAEAVASDDPHVTNIDGVTYDFNGVAGEWYTLVADCDITVNAFMIDAEHPRFPDSTFFGAFAITMGGKQLEVDVRDRVKVDGEYLPYPTEYYRWDDYTVYARRGGTRHFAFSTPNLVLKVQRPAFRYLNVILDEKRGQYEGVFGSLPEGLSVEDSEQVEAYMRDAFHVEDKFAVRVPAFCEQ